MVDALEEEADLEVIRNASHNPRDYIPMDLMVRILDGENPLRVWCKHRSLTQAELASRCGVARPFIAQIEAGSREMSVATLRKLANVLETDVEFLLPHKPVQTG